jgi:hypothetical protein
LTTLKGEQHPDVDVDLARSLALAIRRGFEETVPDSLCSNFGPEDFDPRLGWAKQVANRDLRGVLYFAEEFFLAVSHGDPTVYRKPLKEAERLLWSCVLALEEGRVPPAIKT